ncbi:MAG: NADH-quinone oxidoreductase subunit H, partial [Chloroflexi bacterium]|nr:NADH-quinone oxidoreductase subunit H [Chloroflexota bacterium]
MAILLRGEWYDLRDLANPIRELIDGLGLPDAADYVLWSLIACVAILTWLVLSVTAFIWIERRVVALMQNRKGPNRVGPAGLLQPIADTIKLLLKEAITTRGADRLLFWLAPIIVFIPTIVVFAVVPFGESMVLADLNVGVLFVIAVAGIMTPAIFIAGWSSNNKWSVYGAMREACQMVSYEIPMGMALLLPVMVAGSLNLNTIGQQQSGGWFTWFCFQNPFMFAAALAYYIASLASCKRAPFDLAESESELVAGFHTEYSGFRWSMFFFAEYCAMFVVSGLATILFFGAWYSPLSEAWLSAHLSGVWKVQEGFGKTFIMGILGSGPLWFILKCALLIYI